MKLFYDHIIDKNDLVGLINKKAKTKAEKDKLLKVLDEILHKTVLEVVLVHLDPKHHEEFLVMVHATPHSETILMYLREKAHPQIEEKIKREVESLKEKILKDVGVDI